MSYRPAENAKLVEAEGYRLNRFWNNDLLANADGVWEVGDRAPDDGHPHPALPHHGGGE